MKKCEEQAVRPVKKGYSKPTIQVIKTNLSAGLTASGVGPDKPWIDC